MLSDGTYTVNNRGIMPIQSGDGYIIGTVGNEEVWPGEINWLCIASYILRHADELSKPGVYLGVWRHEGKVYLDVSELHRIPLDEALRIGKSRKQISIWGVGENRAIPC